MSDARPAQKQVIWMGASLADLKALPKKTQKDIGEDLRAVQSGRTPPAAKVLKGFGGASVQELRAWDERKNTYRTVYTVKFSTGVYVLHVFQKKSKTGVETPKHEIEKIRQRLKLAASEHEKQLRKEWNNVES